MSTGAAPPALSPPPKLAPTLKHISLPIIIGTFVLSACFSLFMFVAWKTWDARGARLERSVARTAAIARSVAQHASRTVEAADIILRDVLERLEHEGAGPDQAARMNQLLARHVADLPQIREISVFDEAGQPLFSSIASAGGSRPDPDAYAAYQKNLLAGATVSAPRRAADGTWTIVLSRPITEAGRFRGVVAATLTLDAFLQFYGGFDLGERGRIGLYRDDGTLLAGRPFAESDIGRKASGEGPFDGRLAQSASGEYRTEAAGGDDARLNAYRRLPEYPLVATASLSEYEVLSEWRSIARSDLFTVTVASIVKIILGLIVLVQLRRRYAAEREAKEAAEIASRAKSDFLASMGHELRTPLNAIIGFADLMKHEAYGALGSPRYAEYCGEIQTSGEHLLALINDVLDHAKAEARQLGLHEEIVDLGDIVAFTRRLLGERAAKAELALETHVGDGLCLRADPRRLRQILINLVGNAIKYTPAGGRIVVRAGLDAARDVLIEIEDTGIGIADGDLAAIFEPFKQVDHAQNRKQAGTGLGLPLTKQLVELHGGSIAVRSMPGAGTTFSVRLPAARVVDVPTIPAMLGTPAVQPAP
jgi:signal transduction histidine kinase